MKRLVSVATGHSRSKNAGFSLLEVLLAMGLLAMLVVVTAGILNATQNLWTRTSSHVDNYRLVREAFGVIEERVAQAQLSPYWGVVYEDGQPDRYERLSELRFLVEPTSSILSGTVGLGSAVFFQAPTGFFQDGSSSLGEVLNTWGYFVEYGSDAAYRPGFLSAAGVPEKYRFRLIELVDPSDRLEIFRHTSGDPDYSGREWFTNPLTQPGRTRVLANNIVAFVVLPRLSSLEDISGTGLAPQLRYDSTERHPNPLLNPRHQLPPILEIAAVAIADRSANRLDWGPAPPDLGLNAAELFRSASRYIEDLETVRDALLARGVEARIFRQTIPLAAARWSVEQRN